MFVRVTRVFMDDLANENVFIYDANDEGDKDFFLWHQSLSMSIQGITGL